MPAAEYPEAVGDGEHEAGGMIAPAPLVPPLVNPPLPPPLLLLPGLGHFLDDFFSFIQGNSAGVGAAAVAVAAAGLGACPVGHWRLWRWRLGRPLLAVLLVLRLLCCCCCWLLAGGRGWLPVHGLRLGMVCSKGGGITVDSLIDEV